LENNFSIKMRTLSGETTSATSVAFVLVLVASRKHHLVLIKSLILLLFDFILLIRFSIMFSFVGSVSSATIGSQYGSVLS